MGFLRRLLPAWLKERARAWRRRRTAGRGAEPRARALRLARLAPGATEEPQADCFYSPSGRAAPLDEDALRNALLCLSHDALDFVLVSRGLAEPPRLVIPGELRDSLVLTRVAAGPLLAGEDPPRRLRGRVVRMPALGDGLPETTLESLLPSLRAEWNGPEVTLGTGPPPPRRSFDCSGMAFVDPVRGPRPVVFVWPVFLAMGGVERNAIEVMRHLRGEYDFVVITIERLAESQGSLHRAARAVALATYDLAELGPPGRYLSMLASLERVYSPALVWICNGSPWQCDHAAEIRRLFAGVPIVDQQVYDTVEGWINRYHEPGIQSFDRFVAVNSRIRAKFVSDLGMDPARIDLIYHAIDASRFEGGLFPPERKAELRRRHGLPPDRPVFLFVGRLVPQKRPLLFLELAARASADPGRPLFLLAGDGALAADVEAFVRERCAGSARRVPFTERVEELLAVADGLILTSAYEGLPVVLLEALALGVPVLSTDVGDVRLVLEEYGAGHVVPVGIRPDELHRAFRSWAASLADLREAARAAAPRVRERFSGPAVARQYAESWRRALAGR